MSAVTVTIIQDPAPVTVSITQEDADPIVISQEVVQDIVVMQVEAGPQGPPGPGAAGALLEAAEDLDAGDLVNIFYDAGFVRVRKALGVLGQGAHGYVLQAVAASQDAEVFSSGDNTAASGLTVGVQYLSPTVPGKTQFAVPSASMQLVQLVGYASTSSRLTFMPGIPVLLA